MKFYDYILIAGLSLWFGFGMVVLYFSDQQQITLTWAITSGILVICMVAIFYKNEQKLNDVKGGKAVQ